MAAIPIEFNLNFAINSSQIMRGFEKAQKGMGDVTQSVTRIIETMQEGLFGASATAQTTLDGLRDHLERIAATRYGDVMGTSFGENVIGGLAQEIANGTQTIAGQLQNFVKVFDTDDAGNQIVKNFNIGEEHASGFLQALSDLQTTSSRTTKHFFELAKGFEDINKYSGELTQKQFKPFNDIMDRIAKADSADELIRLNKELKALRRNVELKQALRGIGKGLVEPFQKMRGMFESYFAQIAYAVGLYSVFNDAATAHTLAAQNVARYGVGAMRQYSHTVENVRKGIKEFTDETIRVGKATQTSLTDASRAMGELAQLRLSRNIDELGEMAETTTLMSKAFGISTGDAAQFARSIIQVGGLSRTEFRAAADALAGVQSELGLTESAARATMNQVGIMMRQFRGFGASATDVSKVTREVGRLASAFEKAGMSADEANTILTKMMDPSQINDNIMLWHGLGMTAADGMAMMTGDADQMTGMTERMRDLAKELQAQYGGNAIALEEMAKAYGLNMHQVQALANLSDEDIKTQKERADLEQAALAARQGMQEQLQRMWGSLNIILQEVVMPLMRGVSWVLERLAEGMKLFSQLGRNAEGAGKVIINIIKAIIALLGVGLAMNILKVGKLIKPLLGGFGSLKDQVVGLARGTKDFVKNLAQGQGPMKALQNAISGGGKVAPQAPGAPDPTSAINDTKPEQVSKLGQAFKSFPSPKQILAVAVAILALGAAIAGIILSITVLANTMKDFEWQEMLIFFIGVGGLVAVLMFGMVAAIKALGVIGAAAAPGIFAAATAILTLGASVALIVLSIALLAAALSLGDNFMVKLLGLTVGLTALGLAMTFLAPIIAPAIPILIGFAAALVMLGTATLLIGAGINLMVGAFTQFVTAISEISSEHVATWGQMFMTMVSSLFAFAGALGAVGLAIMAFMPFAGAFIGALTVMSAAIVVMTILGRVSTRLSENIYNLGQGLQLIAQNASIAMEGLRDMMSYFQDNQISALEDFTQRFVKQMQQIAESIMQVQVSIMVGGLAGFVGGLLSSIPGVAAGASQSDQDGGMNAVVDQLVESNEHLEAIKKFSEDTSKSLKVVVRNTQQSRDLLFDFAR